MKEEPRKSIVPACLAISLAGAYFTFGLCFQPFWAQGFGPQRHNIFALVICFLAFLSSVPLAVLLSRFVADPDHYIERKTLFWSSMAVCLTVALVMCFSRFAELASVVGWP